MTDLAGIIRVHGPAYREKYGSRMPECHRRAMEAIERCRTEPLGGQVYYCRDCEEHQFSYHSCKNRHCPKCQGDQASAWLEKQRGLLLPVPHFLVTFTVPAELRSLVRSHQKLLLNILFRTSAQGLLKLSRDPRFLGGLIAMMGVLHTWTRALIYHPHIHYLVPAGGVCRGKWVAPRTPRFLVPVQALSVIFRGKFRDALKKVNPALFATIPSGVWRKPWVVHSKAVGDGGQALKYLSRYVFRVAISNNRILSDGNGHVSFDYRESETGRRRVAVLVAEEFLRRFLQHVLPRGFMKVRYYGLYASANREQLKNVRVLLPASLPADPAVRKKGAGPCCRKCGKAMVLVGVLDRGPP